MMLFETFQYNLENFILENHIEYLSINEQQVFYSLKDNESKKRFLYRHYYLQITLRKFLRINEKVNICKKASGAWQSKEHPKLCITSSSSENCFIIGLSYSKIGIDIEYIKDIEEIESIVDMFFHDDDIANFKNIEPKLKTIYFYKIWTAKEAYIKLFGYKELKKISIPIPKYSMTLNIDNFTYNWELLNNLYLVCKLSTNS